MDYFCYISRSKVDQLYQSINPDDVDEWIEQQSTEGSLGADVNVDFSIAKILNIFKGGITYGRKGIIQRERKIKIHYTEKLRKVLLAIAKDKGILPLFESASFNLTSLFYSHEGDFRISKPIGTNGESDTIITIHTKVKSKTLYLDCSLRFFSEGNEPNGTFILTSTNHRFFSGDICLRLETVFILLQEKNNEIYGTPLFLKMHVVDKPTITLDYYL